MRLEYAVIIAMLLKRKGPFCVAWQSRCEQGNDSCGADLTSSDKEARQK